MLIRNSNKYCYRTSDKIKINSTFSNLLSNNVGEAPRDVAVKTIIISAKGPTTTEEEEKRERETNINSKSGGGCGFRFHDISRRRKAAAVKQWQ